ncbi:MAG: Chromate resistance protein ChrB [Nostoc sp.]|uniref:Chromate resistance protein ChrB n=1 Tax=Nostoc sp. TaxID=1180 RepID=UPI002FEEA5AB
MQNFILSLASLSFIRRGIEGEVNQGQCRDFHSELSEERKINNLTFAELEENEAELTKLRSWLPKIRDRDLFNTPKYSQATEALKACELDFQLFSQQIYQAQGIDSEPL